MTNENQAPALLPCPFCPGSVILLERDPKHMIHEGEQPRCPLGYCGFPVKTWNHRSYQAEGGDNDEVEYWRAWCKVEVDRRKTLERKLEDAQRLVAIPSPGGHKCKHSASVEHTPKSGNILITCYKCGEPLDELAVVELNGFAPGGKASAGGLDRTLELEKALRSLIEAVGDLNRSDESRDHLCEVALDAEGVLAIRSIPVSAPLAAQGVDTREAVAVGLLAQRVSENGLPSSEAYYFPWEHLSEAERDVWRRRADKILSLIHPQHGREEEK